MSERPETFFAKPFSEIGEEERLACVERFIDMAETLPELWRSILQRCGIDPDIVDPSQVEVVRRPISAEDVRKGIRATEAQGVVAEVRYIPESERDVPRGIWPIPPGESKDILR